MDLIEVVANPTWKEFLIDLVRSEQMNPWDIDVGVVANRFLERVRELQTLDLRLPANIILASAILLRFKAETISFDAGVEDEVVDERLLEDEDLPELIYNSRRPRERHVTLNELLDAVSHVMKKGRRLGSARRRPSAIDVMLPETGMDERMAGVFAAALRLKDSEGVLLFSALVGNAEADAIAEQLLPVMHLVQEEKMLAWQDDYFGEIFLRVLEEQDLKGVAGD